MGRGGEEEERGREVKAREGIDEGTRDRVCGCVREMYEKKRDMCHEDVRDGG